MDLGNTFQSFGPSFHLIHKTQVDHGFNRLNDCVLAILYQMDDICGYLDRYDNFINGISILDH